MKKVLRLIFERLDRHIETRIKQLLNEHIENLKIEENVQKGFEEIISTKFN